MRDWLILIAVGAGTYLLRAAFVISVRTEPPAPIRRALPHVGPAVLSAMVVPALILPEGTLSLHAALSGLIAAAACSVAWWRTRNIPLALVVGLATAWAAGAVVGT